MTQYKPVRAVMCLEAVSSSTFCLPNIFGNIQNARRQNLTEAALNKLIGGKGSGGIASGIEEWAVRSLSADPADPPSKESGLASPPPLSA